MTRLKILFFVLAVHFGIHTSKGCGIYFPNRVLLGGDHSLLAVPRFTFHNAIIKIKPPVPIRFRSLVPDKEDRASFSSGLNLYKKQTMDAGIADIRHCLRKEGKDIEEIYLSYQSFREKLLAYSSAKEGWKRAKQGEVKCDPLKPDPTRIPEGIPEEFKLYLRGATHYHLEEFDAAKKNWIALIRLPQDQRRYRSTWARFMLAKLARKDHPEQAIQGFQNVRSLAENGFYDSLALAAASLGLEAQLRLQTEDYVEAIALYCAQMATGDKSAIISLRITAGRALKKMVEGNETELFSIGRHLAENETSRRTITAYLLSRNWENNSRKLREDVGLWLAIIQTSGIKTVKEADRFAWAAYGLGEIGQAQQWLALAPKDTITSRWLKAKLLIREGRIAEAVKHLVFIEEKLSVVNGLRRPRQYVAGEDRSQWLTDQGSINEVIRGELGALYVSQAEFVKALDQLLKGGHWQDSAYLAERVLSSDELKEYINGAVIEDVFLMPKLKYLLGRRLARENRFIEARHYIPENLQLEFDQYLHHHTVLKSAVITNEKRARTLWEMAKITRNFGMEIFGTELFPDGHSVNGAFAMMPTSETRFYADYFNSVTVSGEEIYRVRNQSDYPHKRFHYRGKAADLAWEAAILMPNELDQTATILYTAGRWLIPRDDAAADRFYKALVLRCGTTKLGKAAKKIRWFPPLNFHIGRKATLPSPNNEN